MSKSRAITPITLNLSGGINLADPAHRIADNQSPMMYNWLYRPNSLFPIVRPSIRCAVAVGEKFSTPIVKLFYYVKDSSNQYLMCVSNDDLHYLDGSSQWQKVADLAAGAVPSMITFNGLLLLADGTGIYSWDGTTWATVTTAIQPSVLFAHGNRVVANDTQATGLDAVCFSAVEDETGWTFTSVGGAVLVRAGYKDGLKVNGFAEFGSDLLVSKSSQADGGVYALYRVSTLGDPYDGSGNQEWGAFSLPTNTGAEDEHLMVMGNGVPYLHSKEGFRVISGTDNYGDLFSVSVGTKIRPMFGGADMKVMNMMAFIPKMGTVLLFPESGSEFYAYHPWNEAFTTLGMAEVNFLDSCQAGDDIYLAGDNGYIYTFGSDYYASDLTAPATTADILSAMRTKNLVFGAEGLHKRSEVFIEPITSGTLSFGVMKSSDSNPTELKSLTLVPGANEQDFYIFTDDFGGLSTDLATYPEQDLVAASNSAYTEKIFQKYRGENMTFSITTEGRCGVAEIRSLIATVGR